MGFKIDSYNSPKDGCFIHLGVLSTLTEALLLLLHTDQDCYVTRLVEECSLVVSAV